MSQNTTSCHHHYMSLIPFLSTVVMIKYLPCTVGQLTIPYSTYIFIALFLPDPRATLFFPATNANRSVLMIKKPLKTILFPKCAFINATTHCTRC